MEKHSVLNTELIDRKNPVLQLTVKLPEDGIEMGNILKLEKLVEGERQVYTASKPDANTKLEDLVIVTQLRVPTDERIHYLYEYVGKKGQLVTARRLSKGEIYSITAEGLDGTPKNGSVIEAQAGYKLKAVNSATTGSTTIGTYLDVYNDMYAFQV